MFLYFVQCNGHIYATYVLGQDIFQLYYCTQGLSFGKIAYSPSPTVKTKVFHEFVAYIEPVIGSMFLFCCLSEILSR